MASGLSHLNARGEAEMVDVSPKPETEREATAQAVVVLGQGALRQMLEGNNKKGDVLSVARVAGIQAAKKTSDLIPLCHPLALGKVSIDFTIDHDHHEVIVSCYCKLKAKTGVEMEALTGASLAALTIYDMCKAVDKGISIRDVRLLEKRGGKTGDWSNENR